MAERPLVALTLAFVTGLLLGEVFSYFPQVLIGFTLVLLFFEACDPRRVHLPFPSLLLGALGFLFIQLTTQPFYSGDLRYYRDGGPIRILARVAEPPQFYPKQTVLQMEGIEIHKAGRRSRVQGNFQLKVWGVPVPHRYGDLLDLVIRLRSPSQYQNFGSFQISDFRQRTGLSGVAHLSDLRQVSRVGESGNPLLKQVFQWREEIMDQLATSLRPETAALISAFVLGEPGALSEEVRETFSAAGVAHLLAVSGAHLAFVSLFIFGLSRWLILRLPIGILLRLSLWKIPSQWAALIAGGVAIFYTLLAGAHLGTLRALTMILVYLFSIWIGRRRDAKISLSIAALLILLFQARAIFEISFQLSFIAVLSMVLVMEAWQETSGPDLELKESSFKKGLIGRMRLLFLSTLAATLGTAPLTLFYFHQFSWSGLLANFILLPLAGWIMVPFGLLSVIAALVFKAAPFFLRWQEGLWSFFYMPIYNFQPLPFFTHYIVFKHSHNSSILRLAVNTIEASFFIRWLLFLQIFLALIFILPRRRSSFSFPITRHFFS